MMPRTQLSVRGIRVEQGQGVHIFTFFSTELTSPGLLMSVVFIAMKKG